MSLALYRKYRPGTFAEVKGQEHVTDPLRQALRTGRINHAYLFSGPRGCGKTSSARILARSLNCEKGPTPDPCGECESCVALAPTGPGHLDVIEIDAASHGGVDDARDLRERAFFAPVSARFKIYIIDEAHMVTREGFNALLKLVEEPPPHLKFIFATTEPEKVIGTIKSRTHHYPFRLMPPATLKALMEEILTAESVPFEPAALPMVVRAGAGSARDSLSILDQLLAGAEDDGITYAKAVSLLGYTDGDLLDEVVDAFARRDGGAVFQTVNRVIEGGHDPRRFAADLLERFRDLVILANVPEAATSGLLDRPADELDRLVAQAASMGPAELTRAAEIFNAGLTEMRGAMSPRLLLELMCSRVLLPGAAQGEAALLTRLERLERGGVVAQMAARSASSSGTAGTPAAAPAGGAVGDISGMPGAAAGMSTPSPSSSGTAPDGHGGGTPGATTGAASSAAATGGDAGWPEPVRPGAPVQQPEPVQHAQAPAPAQAPAATGGAGLIQQQWPAVLAALKKRSIVVWANVNTNAQVVGVEGNLVTLGFGQVGAMKNFTGGGKDAVVAGALGDVLGGTWRVEAVVGGSPVPQGGRAPQPGPRSPQAGPSPQGAPSPQGSPSAPGGPSHQGGQSSPGGPASFDGASPGGGGQGASGSPGGPAFAGGSAGGQGGSDSPGGVTPPEGPAAGHGGQGGGPGGAGGAAQGGGPGGAAGGAQGGFAGGTPSGESSGGPQHAGVQGGGASHGQNGAAGDVSWGSGEAGDSSGVSAQPAGSGHTEATGPGQRTGAGHVEAAGDGADGQERERLTTDESWPQAPDDHDFGTPPMPSPTQATSRTPSPGLAAARSAAKAAAQAGPRTPAPRQGGGGNAGAWPDAIPGRNRGPESDDVDPLNDANADVDELSGMALLQRELGAQMIGEIDHT
ncbi:DNA polymerase III subunit gamma and tau [Nonomuraea sp. NPDC049152]|uniref:DNA polymerase III subunit gamma and tau n=1 Tax=Nonomuraea sp. NPDC049152 TaxID=3154350 RepID=UPI0033FB8058